MDAAQETYETWNKIAGLYEEKFMALDLYNQSYDLFCSYINKANAEVLEIGCGPGNICKYLLRQRPDLKILGTDFAPNMVALATKNNPEAKFKVLDARQTRSLNRKFDAIISGFCLPYLDTMEVRALVADLKYMLNPEGVLYLSFVPGDPQQSGFQTGSSGDRIYFYYHTQQMLTDLLQAHGYRVLNTLIVDYTRQSGKESHSIIIATI